MTYECIVKQGHTGAGKFNEHKIYVHASNIIEAMRLAKNSGSVKKGRSNESGQSVLSVKALDH